MNKSSTSRLESFIRGFEFKPFSVGIDVHKNSYHIALPREDGQFHVWVAPSNPLALAIRLKELSLSIRCIAYEAGPTGYTLARVLLAANLPAIVIAPNKIPRPISASAKTDSLDCRRLADYAAKDMLTPIALPTEEEEALRTLVRRRKTLTAQRRQVRQRIKSLLLYHGILEPRGLENWSKKALAGLDALPLRPAIASALGSLLREHTFVQQEVNLVDDAIGKSSRDELPQGDQASAAEYLQTVPGVGPVVAATFVTEVFRPQRFQRGEEVASYLGLAPTVRQSGERSGQARLAPGGKKYLKSILVEAAWTVKRYCPWAANLYGRIVSRTNVPQKAIVAVARKLAIILWRLSLEKRAYEPAMA
ncbi:transposase IS116/IS110/IS902 family protein [Solidesulfovibrio carbinoliphilus subsp. oakridgensis]|uniref:Transposase IS116/IS110/IS902 family protein n=1 Tax=Solidesulfovibrio carbinoliphilus subsp. oakridgensis TaxID=694327 RepID=G7QBJ0_9BACT|nr:IS110 family transposase [Solidesulfovibrio carbinoliphilus]EHJ48853.1 transposase IS116/IS110/IS902 family protein [Solidesulfovibrio carbinoliphilus subsp. oakridgensis]